MWGVVDALVTDVPVELHPVTNTIATAIGQNRRIPIRVVTVDVPGAAEDRSHANDCGPQHVRENPD